MAELTREELVEKRDKWLDKYNDYKKDYRSNNSKLTDYTTLRDRVKKSAESASSLVEDTLKLNELISSGVILFDGKGFGEDKLNEHSESMQKVANNLQPIVDYCDTKINNLTTKVNDLRNKVDNARDKYNEYSMKVIKYDAGASS